MTVLVSVSANGGIGNGASRGSFMTPEGRYVGFASDASNLVAEDTNGIADVFVRDLQSGITTFVTAGAKSSGNPDNGGSESPAITDDGRFVAFYSGATNLVPGVTNSGDIYVRDMIGGITTWASVYARTAVQSIMGATNAVSCNHDLSADSQFVAYQANPVPVPASGSSAGVVLRYNRVSGFTDVVHTNAVFRAGSAEDIRSLDMYASGQIPLFSAAVNGGTGQGPWLVWPTIPGKTYRVQFKNSLGDPVWQDLNCNITFIGNQGYLNDTTTGSVPRFYRIAAF